MNAAELDARIEQAEQRLLAREARVRLQWHALRGRARRAAQPWRLAGPVLGVALGMLAPWWVRRALRGQRTARAAQPGPGLPNWVQWIALAWPLLPVRWRAHVSPATVGTLATLGLSLARRWFSPRAASGSTRP